MGFVFCVRMSASRFASVCNSRLSPVRSISSVVNRPSLARNPSPLPPFVSPSFLYSTAVDRMSSEQTLLRVIESEIKSASLTEDRDLDEGMAPGSFPFKIEDKPGSQTVTLTREYKGEHIKVVVSMPSLDGDENEEDDDEGPGSCIPLVVTVSKKSGLSLEFSCMAFPDEIAIDALSVNQAGYSVEDPIANQGPDFEDLDENLKKTFYKFLEIRGVKASTTNFLHEYMMTKVKREYVLWLENVKKFMEE